MNTEETPIPFKLSPLAEGDAPKRVVPHPTNDYLTRQAFLTDPAKASDEESRVAAQRLAKEALTAQTIAEMPEDQFKSDEEKTAAASKIVELMTGEKDFDGRLWNGGNGFKTGAEYLRSVKETLTRGMGAAADPDLQAWMHMSDAEKDAKVEADRGFLSYVGEAAGDVAGAAGELVRGVPQLSKDEYESAPEDVREASFWMGSVMWDTFGDKERAEYEAKVRDWRGGEWQRLKRRGEYEAKLRRKNALLYLPDMIKSLRGDDAKALAGELAQNPSEMPRDWTARLKRLSTRDIETLAQIRGMTREQTEGGFFNWLGDVVGGVYNGAHGILSGMGAQEAKAAAMAMGWDGERVNEMIARKHALWSAYAGWSSPVSQLSDDHGAVANFTIGLASAVPFIASMHLKGLGYVACATEMMSEADAQAAAAGIDTTNPAYVARSAVAGGLYAYMLKAVSPKFLGASANGAAEDIAMRTAFMKGTLSALAKLDTWKVMSQRTASGALMMAMQQGIAAVNEDLNLGGDAWRDAAQRFTETFVSSIPDMLAFSVHGALEGHARASGGWRKMFTAEGRANRSQNLREAVENAFAVRTAVDGNERIDALRTNTMLAQLAAMRRAWTEGGEKGLARLGFKPEEIAEAKDFFEAERKALGAAEKLDALDRATDAESLDEIAEDAPLAERNDAARRFDEANGEYTRASERMAETLRGKTADAPGVVRDLEAVRNVWAQGNAVGAGKVDKDGNPDGTDAGAAALVKAGFSQKDAAELSRAFGAERRVMYSPAATEALREMYTRSTRGMVEAHAALASAFKGKVRTENGRVLIDLPMPDGGTGTLVVETVDLSRQFYGATGSDPEMARQVEHAVTSRGGKITADDWIKMSDAERRRVVNKYGLIDEGYFMLTDPADPSLHVDSGDADAVMGVIRLDPTADPGAGFHESMHGFLRFCQETGFFDEADIKWLTDTYGTPQNTKEQLNEESAADGFRQYLAKRMAGSFVEEPGPFRKLFGLISRIRHLRDSRAATERLAANAEEALYDAFLAGKYQHIRDLTFAEPVAPKAEAGAGTEAPQTGAPLDKSAPTEQKLVQPQVRETQSQTAVVDESGTTSQKLVQPTAPRVVSFEALTPTGGKKVKGHYEIVPLASLLHSNMAGYPMELQQRDRKGNKGEEQTREEHIANFEPGYLLADPKTDSGAMVVARRPGPDGKPQLVVVSGNGRTMVLEEMAKRNLYDRYRNRMKEWAKENGIENTVADADNPVLVRVVDELGGATLKELADLSNTNAIQQMNEEEQARADADLVRSLDLAKLYKPNMDGSANMAAGASDEFFREFVRATGDTSLLNSDGTFTEALRMRARRALLAIACGQGERGRDVVKKLVEDTDALGIDRQKDAAAAIAPHVAVIEARPEYAIGPDVSRAFADYIEFRENRDTGKKWGTLEEYLKQGDMLDPRSEIAESVMRLLDDPKSAPVLAETVRLYVEAAKGETDGLFGAARTRAEIWRDAAKAVDVEAAEKRYSIAGKVAASNMGIKGAGDAEAMEKAGKDREEIWRTTGWWRGKDGRWRFELPSVKMKSEKEIEAALREGINGLRGGSSETTLEKVLDAPALFEAYPRLKKTKIVFSPEHDDKTGGWYDAGKNEIVLLDTGIKDLRHRPKHEQDLYDTYQQVINSDEFLQKRFSNMDAFGIKHGTAEEERALAKDWIAKFDKSIQDENAAMVRDIVKDRGQYSAFGKIVHEVQHAVQYMETFAKGGNPESAAEFVKNMKRKQRIWAYRLEVEETAKELGTTNPYEIERAILEKLGVTSREQIAGLEADGWIPDREGRDKGYNLFARGYDKEGYEDAYNEYLGEMRKTGRAGWWEGSPNELYNRLAGEVEARNASRREAMTPEERAVTPPWETEDVPADRQIVRYSIAGGIGASNMGIKGAAEAEAMEKAGTDRDEIWRTTGWWRGRDGQWRVEIPDFTLKMETIGKEANESDPDYFVRKRKLSDIITDTRLFEAYPELKKITVETPHHDTFGGASVLGDYNGKRRIRLNTWAMMYDPEQVRSTLAHEIQHAIQYIEGFAKGGNQGQFKEADPWALRRKAKAERRRGNETEAARLEAEAEEIEENALEGHVIENGEVYEDTFEAYQSLAGETESRNVEKRLAMSPEERAATPPWETEDVPEDRQIVRYSVTAQRVTPEEDAAYADAVKRGDMETVRRMEREVYERMGYSDDSSYQGTSAFNGAAPSRNAYFETKAERIEAAKNGEMEDTTTLGDFRDGIDVNNLQFIVFDPRSERNADPMRQEAIRNIRDVLDGGKDTITMYRSVPADVKEGQFRNGDWITPSRAYAEDNARIHGWGKKFRVIEQEVSVEDVWWDGNDIAEWGFDDGKGSVYKNTRANRKLLGPTYDNAGNLIPLSKRFNDWHMDARYSLKAGTATDYSWATLTAKPDMQLAQIDPEKFKNYTDDSQRLDDARKSVLAAGGRIVNGSYVIDMDGSPVVVGGAGILHKYRKPNLENDMLFPILGEVLKKSICVNELNPRPKDKTIKNVFVYLGAFAYNNEICPVRIQVNQMRGIREIDRIDVLHSLNTKIGAVASPTGVNSGFNVPLTPAPGTAAAFGGLAPAYQPLPTISIADLVRIAQPLHPQIFSRDVAAALGVTYRGGELGARYSVTARTPSDEIKADPESFARRSIVSRVIDGDAEERESALVAFVAERALRHGPKPNAFKTIARLGLEMGLKTVDASRIVKKGEALADRVRGTVIEKAIRKGDVATATALLARESDIDRLVAGAAGQGGQLVRAGEGKIKSILDREIEKHIRSFNAASLADVERDTGIDIAGEILANSPERFDPKGSAKREEAKAEAGEAGGEEGAVPGAGAPDEGNITDFERARRERVRKEAEERVAKMIATAKQRAEEAEKQRAEWEAQREERKRQAEAAAAAGEAGGGAGGGGEDGGVGGETVTPERPKLSTFADFKSPEEFAAFFRVWAEERYKKEHGASTLGKHEEKRLFPEFYRKAVVRELQDLADKLLPPKGARATVNRWLGEIQPGVKPDTLERISADVFKFINRNAIRESRTATIQKFRNGLQEFIKGPQFDDLKLDSDRKVTGWVEEAARYIRRVCNLSIQSINGEPSQLEKERAELQAILDRRSQVYDEEGKNSADAPLFDMETRRALAKLQLLDKYGAMKRYMPGQIADLANEAMTWLRDEAGKLEDAWKSARETEESIRAALTGGIVGPNGQKYQRAEGVKGWAERLFDSMNGMIRLRLQHLVRFADSANQQKARDAINRVIVMLGDGEVAFTRHTQNDRRAFEQALTRIFATPDGKGFDRRAMADWLNRMTEAIPADLSRQLSKQGYGDSMTYGQMLQLLVSLEQKSYSEAIAANKRDGQADLIRTFETVGPDGRRERVLTDKDVLFIDWLRSFYEAKRTQLSEVTKRMTGLPVDSPDPLYCPVKMYMGDRARGMHVDDTKAWDPIGAVFSRRVETLRDFDESASILGQFFDRSAEAAKLAAWAERGSIIRGVFTNASVQESIRRAFGGGELTKILKQLEETFNGGENIRKSPGEIAAADKAMNWMTYLSLGYNPLSAMKQTTSFTVWTNTLPGGFKDLWRYMTDVDMATIKHIKESEEYKVRYGVEIGSGQDVATRALNDDPSENPVKKFFKKTSMGLLRKGDFLPGGWIAQGLFRDLYNRHLREGMDPQAADKLAMTETFNMLEETQQSGRTYNTAALAREHGRLGRLLVQFATSPLQQLQYETQALREVWDLKRYKPTTPDADFEKRYSEAKGKLVRAAVINHVLLPAALHAVTNLYRYAMGYDPEWDQEGWHWTMLRDITLGQFSRVFFIGAISSVTWDTLITGKPMREVPALIPAEGVVKLAGNLGVTARDIAKLDYEKVQKDLDRLLKSTSITRTPYDIGRLVTGKAYAEREERREKRRKKEEKAAAKQK